MMKKVLIINNKIEIIYTCKICYHSMIFIEGCFLCNECGYNSEDAKSYINL